MFAGFASVVMAGTGATLCWWVLVCMELAPDETGGLFDGQKRRVQESFLSGCGPH